MPIHEAVLATGLKKACGILFFIAFTGCDVISSLHRKGKKSACLTWDLYGEVSDTFTKLSNCPAKLSSKDLREVGEFYMTTMLPTRLRLSGVEYLSSTQRSQILPTGEVDAERRGMAGILDNIPTNCNDLSETDQGLLQKGLQQEVQVVSIGTPLYCTLKLRVRTGGNCEI